MIFYAMKIKLEGDFGNQGKLKEDLQFPGIHKKLILRLIIIYGKKIKL